MARDRKVDVVIGAKDKASKIFKQVGASIVVMNQGIELATKLARGLGEAYDFAKMGAEVEKTEFAFTQMTAAVGADADTLLAKMRNLTGGTISDFELMQKAAKATTLGVPIDKVGEFAEIARAAAAAMGESTSFMFDSIVTGTARQSKLILDNLGIIINMEKVYQAETKRLGHALSETEKKQAFMNAVIVQGQDIIKDIGDTSELSSEKFAKFEAAVSNLRDTIAAILAGPIGSMLISLADMADRLRWVLDGTNALAVAIQNGDIELQAWNETFEESIQLMDDYLAKMAPAEDKIIEVKDALMTEAEIQALVNEGLNQFRESLGQVPADALAAVDGINNTRTAMGELNEVVADPEPEETKLATSLRTMDIIRKRALGLMKFQRDQAKKEVKDREQAEKDKAKAVQQATDMMMGYVNKYQHMLIDGMLQGQIDLQNIFRNMAGDFLKLFINQILKDVKLALVIKLISLLKLFDVRANDMMVIQMGRDYARYFQQGVFEGMDFGGLAGGMARGMTPQIGGGAVQIGAAVPASGVTVIIQGNLIGEEESIDNLVLAIENKIANRETSTLGTDEWLT